MNLKINFFRSEEFQLIFTEAPPNLLLFEKCNLANCLSKSVLPRKVPKPVPALDKTDFDFENILIYGSPIDCSIISSGKPGPSSCIDIFVKSLLLLISISTLSTFRKF